MSKLKQLWSKIPKKWKEEARSISHTLVAVFLTMVIAQLASADFAWSRDAFVALGAAALRAAIKASLARFRS